MSGSTPPQGPAALIARMLSGDDGGDAALLQSLGIDLDAEYRRFLERRVGGAAALAALTDDPLPDEPFDWSGVAGDITDRVTEVLDLGDAFAEGSFGVEFRTATRRLLAAIASRAPQVFRRRGAASSAAAAVAWVVARDNHLLSTYPGSITAKDLVEAFGRSGSVSARAGTMLANAGLNDDTAQFHCPPEMLLSERRARLAEQRDSGAGAGSAGSLGSAGPLGSVGSVGSRRPPGSASGRSDRDRRGRGGPSLGTRTVHRLKVTLEGIRPPVWRRLLVPSDVTLADLHRILQMSFGWYGGHLHEFEIGGARFAAVEDDLGGFGFDIELETIDEASVALAEVLGEGGRGLYTYDFGDDWRHRIVVEAAELREPGADYPQCVTGRRSGPPEDVGGPWGYREFLIALDDPGHPDHELYVEWAGGDWDPGEFDRDLLDAELRELPLSSN